MDFLARLIVLQETVPWRPIKDPVKVSSWGAKGTTFRHVTQSGKPPGCDDRVAEMEASLEVMRGAGAVGGYSQLHRFLSSVKDRRAAPFSRNPVLTQDLGKPFRDVDTIMGAHMEGAMN